LTNKAGKDESGPKAYLAGPDVFFPNASHIGSEKKRICAKYGIEGLFPLDNEISAGQVQNEDLSNEIFRANCDAMNAAGLLIANIMPFRGVSADAGTAFEIGYMYAQGKPIFAYGRDDQTYLKRVLQSDANARQNERSDAQGMRIEDFGLSDNLMLLCAIRRYGVEVVPTSSKWDDLTAFEECVRLVAGRLRTWNKPH
jgi:nucleoside 2-deoxyribosyltransferase